MVAELQPSKLGTKEYWDGVYEEELANFEEIGDEGEIWFGVESVEKMVKWTLAHAPPSSQPTILEVGSGNGTLLFALAEAGYKTTSLTGIDYTPDAIELAKAIASKRGIDGITFKQCDFLKDGLGSESWDLILDKGTYDAIALGTKDEDGCSPVAQYPSQLKKYLKPGSRFLITSCNFTEEELQAIFATPETKLMYHSRIQHAVYTFGGNSGSICASVTFQEPMV
ncbi:S-adenosyl-L-methionine-dependent methyltransferase [Amanita muscaria]